MKCIIEFLYCQDYETTLEKFIDKHGAHLEAKLHIEVFAMAEKYDIEELKDTAYRAFEDLLDQLDMTEDEQVIVAEYTKILNAVRSLYDMVSPKLEDAWGFRDELASLFFNQRIDLGAIERSHEDLKTLRENVMRETPEFAFDVMNKVITHRRFICKACATKASGGDPAILQNECCFGCKKHVLYLSPTTPKTTT